MFTPHGKWGVNIPTRRQTSHANIFVNAKRHAREKPLLARWVSLKLLLAKAPSGHTTVYMAVYLPFSYFFLRNPDATREENIWSGLVSLAVVFLVLSLLVMPNGKFDFIA